MRRRLLNLLTALSLLACVATVSLWVRSYWAQDELLIMNGGRMTNVGSVAGVFYYVRHASPFPLPRRFERRSSDPGINRSDARAMLVWFIFDEDRADGILRIVMFPQWLVAGLCGLLPAVRLARRRRRTLRRRGGLCPACGYDLRATPGRCPECGKANPEVIPVEGSTPRPG